MKLNDLALWFACSPARIAKLVAAGVIERSARGEYDAAACTAKYVNHLREVAAGRAGRSAAAVNLAQARADMLQFRLRRMEREEARLSERFVSLDASPARLAAFIETALLENQGLLGRILDAAPMLRLELDQVVLDDKAAPTAKLAVEH